MSVAPLSKVLPAGDNRNEQPLFPAVTVAKGLPSMPSRA
jgi:hypothetical protein